MISLKIALCQTEILFENKAENITKASKFIEAAAKKQVDLVLFPEMSFTGFSMDVAKTGENDGYSVKTIRQAAKKHKIAIGFGYVALNGKKGENRYVIVGNNGEILSEYTKIHSFAIGGEREDFISGNELPVFSALAGHKIATFICYDLRFPEIFRAVADRSALITVAANWPESRREHWMTLLKARAIENQVYVAGINCTGNQDGLRYCGDSMMINPKGEVIAQAEPGQEEMIICEIGNDVEEIRSAFPVRESRKKDLYKKIYN